MFIIFMKYLIIYNVLFYTSYEVQPNSVLRIIITYLRSTLHSSVFQTTGRDPLVGLESTFGEERKVYVFHTV